MIMKMQDILLEGKMKEIDTNLQNKDYHAVAQKIFNKAKHLGVEAAADEQTSNIKRLVSNEAQKLLHSIGMRGDNFKQVMREIDKMISRDKDL